MQFVDLHDTPGRMQEKGVITVSEHFMNSLMLSEGIHVFKISCRKQNCTQEENKAALTCFTLGLLTGYFGLEKRADFLLLASASPPVGAGGEM